jgi:hypothetical protein
MYNISLIGIVIMNPPGITNISQYKSIIKILARCGSISLQSQHMKEKKKIEIVKFLQSATQYNVLLSDQHKFFFINGV